MSKCVIPGYESAAPEEQNEALIRIFRRVFSSDEGRIVFNALLTDLFFFGKATTDAEKALCEYAKFFIRERMGINQTFDITNNMLKTIRDQKR